MVQRSNIFDSMNSTVKRATYALWRRDFCWTDYEISWLMKSHDDDTMGMMFRYQDPNNYYRFSWDGEDKLVRLSKMEDGVFTVLDQAAVGYGKERWYQLRIIAVGSDLRVFIVSVEGADLLRVSARDSAFDSGPIALYCWGNEGTYFDDIRVRKISAASHIVQCINGEGPDTILDGFAITGGNANNALIDDFNDGDHNGWEIFNQGNSEPSWSATTGAMVQSSNTYAPNDPLWRGTYALSRTFFGWTDYRLDLTMKSADDDSLGVMFRFQDRYNYYRFRWAKEEGVRRLEKIEGGKYAVLDEDDITYTKDQPYHVTIVADGADIEVYVDANLVFQASDDTFTYGPIALYCWGNQGSYFDDISVLPLPATRPQVYLTGGGVYNENSSPTVAKCIFTGNLADWHGGAIANVNSHSTLLNCIFTANHANHSGGAIYNLQSNPTITNCTFPGNVSDSGGAISNFDGSPAITNCILWADAPDEVNDVNGTTAVTYSDIQGGWDGGQGNIDQNPLLRTLGKADLSLAPWSPSIDTGNNDVVPLDVTDIAGMPRPADGDCDGTAVVDMGAHEFTHAYMGDFDSTCLVDWADYAVLASAWLSEPPAVDWDPLCDIGIPADQRIDSRDLEVLAGNWLDDADTSISCDAAALNDVFGLHACTIFEILGAAPCSFSPNDILQRMKEAGCQMLELVEIDADASGQPVIPNGFHALGSYAFTTPGCQFAAKELWPGALAKPVDYIQVCGNTSYWKPLPPPGYVSLGLVKKSGKPGLDDVRCVKEQLAAPGTQGAEVQSTSTLDTWHIIPADNNGLYVGTLGGHKLPGCPLSESLYVLDARVVQKPEYLTLEDVDQLIQDYGPVLKLYTSEAYFPDQPEWVLDNGVRLQWGLVENEKAYYSFAILHGDSMPTSSATLMDDVDYVINSIKPNPPYDSNDLFKYWLNIPDELKPGDLSRAKALVRVVPWNHLFTEIQFWFFYPFNGPGRARICLSSLWCESFQLSTNGRHYGDWEHVTLRFLNSSQRLVSVYMSANDSGRWFGAEDFGDTLQFQGSHPIVYSAKYSHAHYSTARTNYYKRVKAIDYWFGTFSVDLYDLTNNGSEFRTYLPDKYRIASYDACSVSVPDWLGLTARWGQYERLRTIFSFDYLFDTYKYSYEEVGAGPSGPPMKRAWRVGDSGEALGDK